MGDKESRSSTDRAITNEDVMGPQNMRPILEMMCADMGCSGCCGGGAVDHMSPEEERAFVQRGEENVGIVIAKFLGTHGGRAIRPAPRPVKGQVSENDKI